jgi:hypothetical protein
MAANAEQTLLQSIHGEAQDRWGRRALGASKAILQTKHLRII